MRRRQRKRRDYALTTPARGKDEIAIGSLSDVAVREDISLAEAFAGAERIILLDVSSSMENHDAVNHDAVNLAGHMVSRHEAAHDQVLRLQEKYQGKIALFCFSTEIVFCPDGVPNRLNQMTAMGSALRYIKAGDDMGIGIDLISDGAPTESEEMVREIAGQFKTPINTIYIGPEWGGGREFLMSLARLTGGHGVQSKQVGQFYEEEERLLLSSG